MELGVGAKGAKYRIQKHPFNALQKNKRNVSNDIVKLNVFVD